MIHEPYQISPSASNHRGHTCKVDEISKMTLTTDPVVIVNEYKVTRKTRFVAPSRPTANDPTYENWWETRGVNRARRATSPCKARSTAPTQIKVPVLLQQKRTPGTTCGSAPSPF